MHLTGLEYIKQKQNGKKKTRDNPTLIDLNPSF